ncbi:hypothetical protein ERJ75_001640800 [Trypanosoma vivax]|nr:hypothetical protein ERJ75_001640800 [Trypanosoma vivax]
MDGVLEQRPLRPVDARRPYLRFFGAARALVHYQWRHSPRSVRRAPPGGALPLALLTLLGRDRVRYTSVSQGTSPSSTRRVYPVRRIGRIAEQSGGRGWGIEGAFAPHDGFGRGTQFGRAAPPRGNRNRAVAEGGELVVGGAHLHTRASQACSDGRWTVRGQRSAPHGHCGGVVSRGAGVSRLTSLDGEEASAVCCSSVGDVDLRLQAGRAKRTGEDGGTEEESELVRTRNNMRKRRCAGCQACVLAEVPGGTT